MARPRSARQLEPDVRALLRDGADDVVRARLEELDTREPNFSALTGVWGPELWARNSAVFRPFILAHMGSSEWDGGRMHVMPWTPQLQAWMDKVDAADDVQLFRQLWRWRAWERGRPDATAWCRELVQRWAAARSPAAQRMVLRKLEGAGMLDEGTALALYRGAPALTRRFILAHLPHGWISWGRARVMLTAVVDEARARQDHEFAWDLYRRGVPYAQWKTEVETLAASTTNGASLCTELEKRHPVPAPDDIAEVYAKLLEQRGDDVIPYVRAHLRDVWAWGWRTRRTYKGLAALAMKRGWVDLWAAVVRTCAPPDDFNEIVDGLVARRDLSDEVLVDRLLLVGGVSREANLPGLGLAQVHQLKDDVALRLYLRFPFLVHGAYRMHVSGGWWGRYPLLVRAALDARDDELVDFLASRLVTRDLQWDRDGAMKKEVEPLAAHYEALSTESGAFTRRAANVLAQVPAYAVWNIHGLVRSNRLARLMLQRRPGAYLEDAAALRDLLEAPMIHVQVLAWRELALDDPRARALARENLPLLLATLLRKLHRRSRQVAFKALQNAAMDDEAAALIARRARDALALPDARYPRDDLIALLGNVLWRYPALRTPREHRVVHGEVAP